MQFLAEITHSLVAGSHELMRACSLCSRTGANGWRTKKQETAQLIKRKVDGKKKRRIVQCGLAAWSNAGHGHHAINITADSFLPDLPQLASAILHISPRFMPY